MVRNMDSKYFHDLKAESQTQGLALCRSGTPRSKRYFNYIGKLLKYFGKSMEIMMHRASSQSLYT